jgi:IMP dehydrogenase
VPKYSSILSRKEVTTKTRLTKNIFLNIPIVSANMDTVTEAGMAIALAQLGGIGIIHRFNTIEQQAAEVERVKRYRNAVIENPLSVPPETTLEDALEIMKKKHATSVLVTENRKLIGILTSRDYRFKPDLKTPVSKLMTRKDKLIVGNSKTTIDEAKKILLEHKIEKLPIVDNEFHLTGLITGKDIYNKTKYPDAAVDSKDRLIVGAAIGVKSDSVERAGALINAGADVLVLDIAHGHSRLAIETLKSVKESYPHIEIIAGNVATAEGTRELIEAGADAIKVGVGPGSICITRIITGCGYPQLSAVLECSKEAKRYSVPIIADGGIKQSGDITKAIGAGASTVMLGSMLAGTDESPGVALIKNGKKFKVIRGMASYGAKFGREVNENRKEDFESLLEFVPEGVEANVPYKGNVAEIIFQLLGGLRSGMSYCGANTIEDLRTKAEFVRITSAGLKESHAHDVNIV